MQRSSCLTDSAVVQTALGEFVALRRSVLTCPLLADCVGKVGLGRSHLSIARKAHGFALLREIQSDSTFRNSSDFNVGIAFCGQKLQWEFFNRIGRMQPVEDRRFRPEADFEYRFQSRLEHRSRR